MKKSYDAIFLSPHLDDAVLSCGGQISARAGRGESLLIATLAAGDPAHDLSPFARALHDAWGITGRNDARRVEDMAACLRIGADYWHSEVPDAIYRYDQASTRALYASKDELFGQINPDDPARHLWERQIRELPPAKHLYVPLGAGGHVDHQLVREAAERICGDRIHYYEDFPYVTKLFALRRLIAPRRAWQKEVIALPLEDVQARCDASCLYESQLHMLAGGRKALEKKIQSYVRRIGGERIWRRA